MDALKELESCVDDTIALFMAKMEEMSASTIDMGLWAQLLAFGKHVWSS